MSNKIPMRAYYRKIRRDYYKNIISKMSEKECEKFYFERIREIIEPKQEIKTIAGFMPIKNEPDCLFLLKKFLNLGYELFLPFIEQKHSAMIFRQYTGDNTNFIKDIYGIPCPDENAKAIAKPDVVLVPLLAFDSRLFRLGYGGGFYDKFLGGLKKKEQM